MATQTANPGTVVNDSSLGAIAWTNPSNGATENGTEASSNIGSNVTQLLKGTNCGFSVPGGATIDGISMRFKRRNAGTDDMDDLSIRLVKGGVISGTNKAANTWDNATLTWSPTYGGAADLWGLALTPSDVNASDFGVVVSGQQSSGTDNDGRVDAIELTVHYTPAAGSSATVSFALGGIEIASASESDPPVFSATTAFALGGIDLAAVAEGPLYSATTAFALGGIELSAHVEPSTGAATCAFQLGGIELAAAIDTGTVDYSAAVDFSLGPIALAAVAEFDQPTYTASVSFSLGGIDILVGANVWTAFRVAFALGGIDIAASATAGTPTYSAATAFALGGIRFAAAGTSEHPQAGFCAEAGQVAFAGGIAGMVSGAGAFAGQVGC